MTKEKIAEPKINIKLGLAYTAVLTQLKIYQKLTLGLLTLTLFLAGTVFILLLSSDKEVVYIEMAKSEDIHFRIIPSPLNKENKQLLIRQQLRDYVYNRTQIDNITELYRFEKVIAMSTIDEHHRFKKEYDRINGESSFNRRDVKIVTDAFLSANLHQVELETIDYFENKTYKNYWTVHLTYEFRKQRVTISNETKNPLGLIVTNYIVRKKSITYDGLSKGEKPTFKEEMQK